MQRNHKVFLQFWEDDATGEWGVSQPNTINCNTPFNAFWSAMGIFHDVFEHYFEDNHKYFTGDNSFNIGGEMAAMGAMWYYYETLSVSNRLKDSNYRYTQGEIMRSTTQDLIQEAIQSGYTQYGNILECGVPYQRPVDNSELEYQITEMYKNIQGFNYDREPGHEYYDEQEHKGSKNYKDSVTFQKIANLHRYGYRMAQKLIPDTFDNMHTLYNFFADLETFCKRNNPEELYSYFRGLEVNVNRRSPKSVKVSITLVSHAGSDIPDYKIRDLKYFSIEDVYTSIPEDY